MTILLDKIAPATDQKLLSAGRRASREKVNFPDVFRQKFDWLDAKRIDHQHGADRLGQPASRTESKTVQKESTASVRPGNDRRHKTEQQADTSLRSDNDRQVENKSAELESQDSVTNQNNAASRTSDGESRSETLEKKAEQEQKPATEETAEQQDAPSPEQAVALAAQEQLVALPQDAVQRPAAGGLEQDAGTTDAEVTSGLPAKQSQVLLNSLQADASQSTVETIPVGTEVNASDGSAKPAAAVTTPQIVESSQQAPNSTNSQVPQSVETVQAALVAQAADSEADATAVKKSSSQDERSAEPVKVSEHAQRPANHSANTVLHQAVQQPADVSRQSDTHSESRHALPQDVAVVQMQTAHHDMSSVELTGQTVVKTDSVMQPGALSESTTQTPLPERGDAAGQENVSRVVKAAQAALGRGSSQIQIRLDPPELGHLRIAIRQSSSGLQLQLQATNPRALHMIEHSSGELRAALESQGLHATRIDVQLRSDLRQDQSTPQQQDHGGRSGWQGGSLSQQGQAFGDHAAGQNNFYGEQSQDMSFFNSWDESRPESSSEQAVGRPVNSTNKVDLTV